MSELVLLGLKPTCASGRISSDMLGISLLNRIFAIILLSALKSEIPRLFPHTDLSPLFL